MPPKRKKTITTKEINAALNTIYHDEAGKKVDMRIRKANGHNWRRILVGSIVFFGLIFAVSWLGIMFFGGFGGSSDNLKLEILGDKNVTAGADIEYEIKYKNNGDMPLASSEIGLYLPKTFVLSSSTPLLDDRDVLKIGTLEAGDGGSIIINGKFFSAEGEKNVLQAVLIYKPSNFNSTFQKVAKLEVETSGSVFDGSLEGPDKISVGSDVEYELTYINISSGDLENLAIEAVLPADFIISTSTPAIDKDNHWALGTLKPQEEGSVKIAGSFGSGAKGNEVLSLKLGIINEDETFLSLIEKTITTEVIGGDFSTTLTVNGVNTNTTVRWGKTLNFCIAYKNEGKEILYDVELAMDLSALPKEKGKSILDWISLIDMNKGNISGETITWTKNEISGLKQIKADGQGTIDFSIDLISKPASPSYKDYKVDSVLKTKIGKIGNLAVAKTMQANKITIYIDSDAELESQARYYDDSNVAVGSGPVPPILGQKTAYKIYWKITNSMHELENIIVSADLGNNVVFGAGSADAGTIALDPSLKKVQWTLNRLPISVGSISGIFDVSLTPTAQDMGNVLDILENIVLTAKDKSTGGTIIVAASNETTDLKDDPYVTVGGRVTP